MIEPDIGPTAFAARIDKAVAAWKARLRGGIAREHAPAPPDAAAELQRVLVGLEQDAAVLSAALAREIANAEVYEQRAMDAVRRGDDQAAKAALLRRQEHTEPIERLEAESKATQALIAECREVLDRAGRSLGAEMPCELRAPGTVAEWAAYHAIRRRVLFELRGRDDYDPAHADESRPGHYPLVLFHEGRPLAVIRIDVDEDAATFRRVAVREDAQRRGHGRQLLAAAERFARDRGCRRIVSHVDNDAVTFYGKCGFRLAGEAGAYPATELMTKALADDAHGA